MPAYLRPTVQSGSTLKFAARTYWGALAIAVLGGGAFSAYYVLSNRLARLYFLAWAIGCFLGAFWRLFWRDDIEIDLLRRCYTRRRGHWPKIRTGQGSLDEITAVTIAFEKRQDRHGGLLDFWTVGLRFTDTTEPLLVAEFLKEEQRARDLASHMAARLHKPCESQAVDVP
jgi:hypothetical protein